MKNIFVINKIINLQTKLKIYLTINTALLLIEIELHNDILIRIPRIYLKKKSIIEGDY